MSLVGVAEVMIILIRVSAVVASGFNLMVRAFERFRLSLDTSVMDIRNTPRKCLQASKHHSVPGYRLFITGINLTVPASQRC